MKLKFANSESANGTKERFVIVWCPGCQEKHAITIEGRAPIWDFNGDEEKPTFSPSLLLRGGHYIPGHVGTCWCDYNRANPSNKAPFECKICHSFIRDGQWEFLSDCTHELAGRTVPMVDLPDYIADF